MKKYRTCESVCKGHPDKLCDLISDSILDACLRKDKSSRVACEVMATKGHIIVAGEITCSKRIDIRGVVRRVLTDVGYSPRKFLVFVYVHQQSKDIAGGVDRTLESREGDTSWYSMLGAGDQGTVYGYATNETSVLMPAPIYYAHRLMQRQSEVRKDGRLPWLRPDAKAQLTCVYDSDSGKVKRIDTVVLSTQHDPDIDHDTLKAAVIEHIIKPVLPADMLTDATQYLINPTGRFVIGGPQGDCGLTGRKIIVDTYGGAAPHGGGAFSGKDPTKVDRSAAYACRYVAKNIVAAGLASQCQIQISYAIGIAQPTSIAIDTFGTGKLSEEALIALVRQHFDLRPKGIIQMLDLQRPIYSKTAAYGHFGREEPEFTWERTDKAALLRAEAGL